MTVAVRKRRKAQRPARGASTAFADKMYRKVTTGDPPIQKSLIDQIERRTERDGVTRRAALWSMAMATERMAALEHSDVEGAVAVATVAVCARDYATRLRSLAELMETAALRIDVAMCARQDMQAIYKQAERESTGETVDAN